jgi:hypothetical protein
MHFPLGFYTAEGGRLFLRKIACMRARPQQYFDFPQQKLIRFSGRLAYAKVCNYFCVSLFWDDCRRCNRFGRRAFWQVGSLLAHAHAVSSSKSENDSAEKYPSTQDRGRISCKIDRSLCISIRIFRRTDPGLLVQVFRLL